MSHSTKQILVILLTIILAVLGFLQGFVIWDYLGVKGELAKSSLTIGSSLMIVFSGFFLTLYDLIGSVKIELQSVKRNIFEEMISAFPNYPPLNTYSGNEGLMLLCGKLSITKLALNTRFTPKEFGVLYSPEISVWNDEILKNLGRGLIFREVVCNSGTTEARRLISDIRASERIKGAYKCVEIVPNINSCINFIVLHLNDGTKEVWFGWVLSKGAELERLCFKSIDKDLVNMFEDWHTSLSNDGDKIY